MNIKIILIAIISFLFGGGSVLLFQNISFSNEIIIVLNDKRCEECVTTQLTARLKQEFPKAKIKEIDYSDKKGKELFKETDIKFLPAIIFTEAMTKNPDFEKIRRYTQTAGKYNILQIGSSFDPTAEICDNNIDDNNNGAVDCKDETCKSDWKCMEKLEKPIAEIFVMSHCPYGTQFEKGLLPVWNLLKDKADISIKFCNYAMHGKKEIDEQLTQYCIQKESKEKFRTYLTCFLGDSKSEPCIKKAKVNKGKLAACIKESDKKFEVTKNFEAKDKWNSRFPPFLIFDELNKKYDIKGSPSIVVNSAVAKSGRSSADILKTICTGFKNPPKECSEKVSDKSPSPGFGWKEGEAGSDSASCS